MKFIFAVFIVTIFSITFITAQEKMNEKQTKSQSIAGYLVDKMCGERMVTADVKKSDAKAARHTRDCGLEETCSAEGYGLVTGGKFYKFDVAGDKKAKEYLKAVQKENNIQVKVLGTINDEQLAVDSIKDFKLTPEKQKKK
jgi:hypothetical protein